ncbi:hypothetical protein [Dietzia sp.]|uniref:hypothetical protein n=1 Tax=Dietzia sp. TaxID=1871616 RepID=UPI002FDADEA3
MTSPTSGFRRSLSVAGIAVAAVALTACGAGQHSQTASKVAAVDGGSGKSQNVVVNDFYITVPVDEQGQRQEGPGQVNFIASFSGTGIGAPEGAALESVTIDGKQATIEGQDPRIPRDCSLVVNTEQADNPDLNNGSLSPGKADDKTACITYAKVVLPDAAELNVGQSVEGEIKFSGENPISTRVSVNGPREASGEYTRSVETNAPSEEH